MVEVGNFGDLIYFLVRVYVFAPDIAGYVDRYSCCSRIHSFPSAETRRAKCNKPAVDGHTCSHTYRSCYGGPPKLTFP